MGISSYLSVYKGNFGSPIGLGSAVTLAVILGVIWLLCANFQLGPYARFRGLPPGPPASLLFGTRGYVNHQPHHYFRRMSLEYGPIVSIWKGQTLQIVLNSPEDIKELCDKRGTIYNGRPPMIFHDIISSGIFVPTASYNDVWRKQRRIISNLAGRVQVKNLLPVQLYETKQYLSEIIDDPHHFISHGERFGSSLLTSTIYGFRAHSLAHPSAKVMQLIGNWMENKMSISRYIEDSWPILHKLPPSIARWRKQYHKDAEIMRKVARSWWDPCKMRVEKGVDIPCFATSFVKSYESEGWSDDDASLVALGLMMAGAGTTSATISFFIMGCCTNPQAVRLAQEELDRVVGDQRLPSLDDEPNLPYIRAMIKENLRWRPISNHGMIHSTTKEDYYKGYRIPKGTVIIANAYSIHQNEAKFKDPDTFEPMRYYDYPHSAADALNLKDANERDHFAYGAGRRVCAGIHVAEVSLFIAVAHLLWTFNIEYARDKKGNKIPINTLGYNVNFVLHPADLKISRKGGLFGKPYEFEASLTPRSAARAAFIKKAFSEATTDVRSLADEANDGNMRDMEELVKVLEQDPESYPAGE